MTQSKNRYQQIASDIEQQIRSGVLSIGDRLPSLRSLCAERGVSMNTAIRAFHELEKLGFVEAKPQSGYVVSYSHQHFKNLVDSSHPKMVKGANNLDEIMQLLVENYDMAKIRLSSAMLDSRIVPINKLNAALVAATKSMPDSGVNYSVHGSKKLKTQIAKRATVWGGKFQPDDIITTSGSMDGIAFSLLALTQRGDTIAVESPVYYGILRLAHSLGLRVIELPTHPKSGVDIDSLEGWMKKGKLTLCILVSNFCNPMGSCMPDAHKKAVATMAEQYGVPIIEDDVYGELFFGNKRPVTIKAFDKAGMVLWCGSFSKTLVSGYRVGWIEAGRYKKQVELVKHHHTLYCSTVTHEAVGIFLEMGRYEHHLKKLRSELYRNYLQFQRSISLYFPDQTKVTHPTGGMNLWVEFPKNMNTIDLYNEAILNKISISPGRIYTLQHQYNHCLKLSFGMKWNNDLELALKRVGKLAKELL